MRLKLDNRNIKHFAKIINVYSKFSDEVRIYSDQEGLTLEACKDDTTYGSIKMRRHFFDSFDPSDPIDKFYKSKAIIHVFKSPLSLHKNLIRYEISITNDCDYLKVTQIMRSFNRILTIPQKMSVRAQINFVGEYRDSFPAGFKSPCKRLFTTLREMPNSSGLVSFRIRPHGVKIETGEREDEAEIFTHLRLDVDEFIEFKCERQVNVTFDARKLKSFLSAWDPKNHSVRCYFNEEGLQIFEITDIAQMDAILAVSNIAKEYRPTTPTDATVTNIDPNTSGTQVLGIQQSRRQPNEYTSNSSDIVGSGSHLDAPDSLFNRSSPVRSLNGCVTDLSRTSTQSLGAVPRVSGTQVLQSNQPSEQRVIGGFDRGFYNAKLGFQTTLRQLHLLGLNVNPESNDRNSDEDENNQYDLDSSEYEMSDDEDY